MTEHKFKIGDRVMVQGATKVIDGGTQPSVAATIVALEEHPDTEEPMYLIAYDPGNGALDSFGNQYPDGYNDDAHEDRLESLPSGSL